MCRRWKYVSLAFVAALTFVLSGCFAIDEDLSDCGEDYKLTYQLRLITNLTTELDNVLNEESDRPVADALRTYLSTIFSDYAHDVDLAFYDTKKDSSLTHHESHIMDANQSSYTIYLPVRQYMHLAVANMANEKVVSHIDDKQCHQARLKQERMDTIPPHTTGIFTARQPMEVIEGQSRDFLVQLYMANSAVALVIDTMNVVTNNIQVDMTDMATDFNICDSTYLFDHNPIVRAPELPVSSGRQRCYTTVCFPSHTEATRAEGAVDADGNVVRINGGETGSIWRIQVYVTMPNEDIVLSTLHVRQPLGAGNLRIIKVALKPDGSVVPSNVEVGASIELGWKKGNVFPV